MPRAAIRRMLGDWEHWLFALAYAPSMLLFATSIPSLLSIATGDRTVLWLSVYVAVSGGVPMVRLLVALLRRNTKDKSTSRVHRAVRIGLVLNWLPHHAAVVLVGLASAIASEGLID
jgi:asparagine N-glycosylation enzyme membrane subunit Stt3